MINEKVQKDLAEECGLIFAGKNDDGELEFVGDDGAFEKFEEAKSKVCDLCGGTGIVNEDVWDEDSHTYQPTGTTKCLCQIEL